MFIYKEFMVVYFLDTTASTTENCCNGTTINIKEFRFT